MNAHTEIKASDHAMMTSEEAMALATQDTVLTPRFYTTDPQKWEDILNSLKDYCEPEAQEGSS